MKYWLIGAAIVASSQAIAANAVKPNPSSDTEQINSIVETFRTSVASKNKDAFLKLFFSENIPWIGVTSDEGLKLLASRKADPAQPDPVKVYSADNPTKFIDGLISAQQKFEDKFSNVHIDTDGNLAQVYFDYSFWVGTYKINWGKESWQLVHTTSGWKINSVVWSMDINPELPKAPQ